MLKKGEDKKNVRCVKGEGTAVLEDGGRRRDSQS
jgi:hypothetical protein